jgi:hypothetical protein
MTEGQRHDKRKTKLNPRWLKDSAMTEATNILRDIWEKIWHIPHFITNMLAFYKSPTFSHLVFHSIPRNARNALAALMLLFGSWGAHGTWPGHEYEDGGALEFTIRAGAIPSLEVNRLSGTLRLHPFPRERAKQKTVRFRLMWTRYSKESGNLMRNSQ